MRIVIVGGGFAGINLAKALANKKNMDVVLVDRNNYNFFPPLLYQVATSFIESSNITYPFRKMFQGKENIHIHYGSLIKINVSGNNIETDTGQLYYDQLVLAMGTEANYFGMENVRQNSLPMKNIDDALTLRNHLLTNLEKATRTSDAKERERLMTIVIAGGGPTGVEISGMLAEMRKKILEKDYPELNNKWGAIYLVDPAKALLGAMSVRSQKEAFKQISALGVTVKLGTGVKDGVADKVTLSSGEEIPACTLVWASGVIAREAPGLPAESIGRGRRILVDAINKVNGSENIFAIGDICLQTSDRSYPNGHPQLAQVAIQQGKVLAGNFKRMAEGNTLKPFRYFDKGSMAIISKYKAVVDLPRAFIKGFFAWLIWLFIHLIPIAGFRNKLKLSFNWMWSFITNDPTLRLIIRPIKDH